MGFTCEPGIYPRENCDLPNDRTTIDDLIQLETESKYASKQHDTLATRSIRRGNIEPYFYPGL
jgi:hypothetical protein